MSTFLFFFCKRRPAGNSPPLSPPSSCRSPPPPLPAPPLPLPPHAVTSGSVAVALSRPKKPITEFVSTGVVCPRSEEHTSELQSQSNLECRLPLDKIKRPQCPISFTILKD